jgi:hypothetical protein
MSPLTLSKTTLLWHVGTANLVKEMDELRMEINELRLERQAAMQQASPLPAACWDR